MSGVVAQLHAAGRRQAIGPLVRWFARTYDFPELIPLYVAVSGTLSLAAYSLWQNYRPNSSVSRMNRAIRSDSELQVEEGVLWETPDYGHSLWYRLAQVKKDKDGANIGIFHNRMRPFEYEPHARVPMD